MVYTPENTIELGMPADVFVNGKLIEHAFFADTGKGKVKAYRSPFKIHKRKKEAISKTIYGDVKVVFKNVSH